MNLKKVIPVQASLLDDLESARQLVPAVERVVDKPRESVVQVAPIPEVAYVKPVRTGLTLSNLLQGVSAAVSAAFSSGAWTMVDVVNVSGRGGHVYLELAERDKFGSVVAKANGMIWANMARQIIPAFERATGARLAGGIKLLVRARPVFKAQFGFSLEIDDIDPEYTLGDLEARKREIRSRLQNEGVFDAQSKLPTPWDYNHVLVMAPDAAAGLGDFQAESHRLADHGICEFVYVHSRFQGEGAASAITTGLREALRTWKRERKTWPDAVVIIRGGGAANDLAWLNDYELALLVCKVPIPVFTGIGHERDTTLLDEVAHTKFDTPSKVIAGIEQVIVRRTREAKDNFEAITYAANISSQRARAEVQRLDADNRANARRQIEWARMHTHEIVTSVKEGADKVIQAGRERSAAHLAFILERGVSHTLRVRVQVDGQFDAMQQGAKAVLHDARGRVKGLIREIIGQGPDKTLSRGFTVTRAQNGKPITRAKDLQIGQSVSLQFLDGTVSAHVEALPTLNLDISSPFTTEQLKDFP